MIDGSVEPTDSIGVAPSARRDGFEMTAPPMPSMPESTPVTKPANRVAMTRAESVTDGNATSTGAASPGASTLFAVTSNLDLRGVWVPLITPFDEGGAVDAPAIDRLCREYLDAGVTGIVALEPG